MIQSIRSILSAILLAATATSAGDPTCDLVELELALTPATRGTAWRQPFFDGYGSWPSFEGYKRRVLCDLLFEVSTGRSAAVPDRQWLDEAWPRLMDAANWADLRWYPEGD